MMEKKPLLLCLHMDPTRVMRLSFLAPSLGIQVRAVPDDQWGQPLGALCGLDAPRSHPAPARVGEEMLVMAFFPDALMDRLLPLLRKELGGVRLKAVLTAHNRPWTAGMLYTALAREAAQLDQRQGTR